MPDPIKDRGDPQFSDLEFKLMGVAATMTVAFAQTLGQHTPVDPTGQSPDVQATMAALWHQFLTSYLWLESDFANAKDFPLPAPPPRPPEPPAPPKPVTPPIVVGPAVTAANALLGMMANPPTPTPPSVTATP